MKKYIIGIDTPTGAKTIILVNNFEANFTDYTGPMSGDVTMHYRAHQGRSNLHGTVLKELLDDFNIDPKEIEKHITSKTKAVISVDFGGWPVDYTEISDLLSSSNAKEKFTAALDGQLS